MINSVLSSDKMLYSDNTFLMKQCVLPILMKRFTLSLFMNNFLFNLNPRGDISFEEIFPLQL